MRPRTEILAWPALVLLWSCVALLLVIAALTMGSIAGYIVLAVAILTAVLAIPFSAIRVHVRDDGLLARSPVGVPRFFVPAESMERVSVRDVSALREYGGWGLRFRSTRDTGLIMRSGSALVVHQRGGSSLTIGLAPAEQAAREIEQRFSVPFAAEGEAPEQA